MRILQVHNFYQQAGGEDQVCAAEYELLRRKGHQVGQYLLHNDAVAEMPAIAAGLRTIWNQAAYRALRLQIRRERPDVVHAHNTFPLVSPALYYAARAERVPVVQTLHNFRLICPAATLFRNGHVCEECVGKIVPLNSVVHGCYRSSRAASSAVAAMLTAHRAARTWTRRVDLFVALTEFARQKFAAGGLPASRIAIKPNFLVDDPCPGAGQGGYALFIGRLVEEKGLRTLLEAWRHLPEVPLLIAGDGPLRSFVSGQAAALGNVTVLGQCARERILFVLREASLLIIPSEWYEGFPLVAVEAMACGTPAVASDLGALRELVTPGVNGARFVPGNARSLAECVRSLLATAAGGLSSLRATSRLQYERHFTAEQNYATLIDIYRRAGANCS